MGVLLLLIGGAWWAFWMECSTVERTRRQWPTEGRRVWDRRTYRQMALMLWLLITVAWVQVWLIFFGVIHPHS